MINIYMEKQCPQCDNIFVIPANQQKKKFCSRSCSVTYSNARRTRSNESKNKTRLSLLNNGGIDGEYSPIVWNKCIICDTTFYVSPTPTNKRIRKTCSGVCYIETQRRSGTTGGHIGGKVSAANQCRRSKDEIDLYKLCINHFGVVGHNEPIANGWDADILLYDYKVAILWNGPWHYKEMPGLKHSLKQVQNRDKIKTREFEKMGWDVVIFEDREYTPETAFKDIEKLVRRENYDISTFPL